MEMNCQDFPARKFLTPPCGNSRRWSPMRPMSEKKWSSPQAKRDLFHVIHKVPAGDSPYVRAKHVQLIDKDPGKAVSLFWAAINSGDRVDSSLKDMAVVMKQLNRADEAIEAIKSFRHLCPAESQESLDNVLVELYKRSGRIEDQIEMLELKVKSIEEGIAFAGKRTKSARSQGKKILITIEQEYSRLLGNLAWAYLQNSNYKSAEELYRKALSLEQDKNKQCNLAICLMHMNKMTEARFLLQTIRNTWDDGKDDESFAGSYERATQVLAELELQKNGKPILLEEASQIKGTSFRDQHDNPCSASTNLKFGSFETGDMETFSPHIPSVDHENIYGRRAAFLEKRNDRWVRDSMTEASFSCRKPYTPLVSGKEIPRVPYTQPKRAPSPFIGRDQSNGAAFGGCTRKLSFDKPPARGSLQLSAIHNSDGQPCISGDWRKKSSEDHSTVLGNNGCVRKSNPKEAKSTTGRSAGQKNLTEEGLRDFATKPTDSEKRDDTFAENTRPIQEPPVQSQSCHNLSCQEAKRTWADMVEEDEQEFLSGRTDEACDCGEEFADENVNSNITYHQALLTPSNNMENLSQKLASCDFKDGYHTQPESTKDRVVRRALCFGQQHNCCSPLQNVSLNFEGCHSSLECVKEQHVGTKLLRRNRLQVFRDITP